MPEMPLLVRFALVVLSLTAVLYGIYRILADTIWCIDMFMHQHLSYSMKLVCVTIVIASVICTIAAALASIGLSHGNPLIFVYSTMMLQN